MTLSAARWHVIAESSLQWEREALEWLREQLPDREPWHVWTNFEFIDDEGRVNQVDALALSPAGLFLVEIRSRTGTLTGDTHTWTWSSDGHDHSDDNPLLLADRKCKRLENLLRRQSSIVKAKIKLPTIEPAVFLSSPALDCRLAGLARSATFQRGRPGEADDDGIVAALGSGIVHRGGAPVDKQQASAIWRGLTEAGIRPSSKHRQVGDYRLGRLLAEGESHQDWDARHVSLDSVHRRVRIYTVATASSPEARASRVRQARREFEVLEGIDHPGILKAKDYKDTELGPALVFDHDPRAQRLDHLLRERGAQLTLTQRLQLVRDIAEVLRYAHAKRLFHRALGPQCVLIHGEGSAPLVPQLMNWQTASRNAGEASPAETLHRTTGTRHVVDYVADPDRVYLAPETLRADPAQASALDVFSLGAIAYHVFSGQPPAGSELELAHKLRTGPGLRLSDVLDGCGAEQQELIQLATWPEVGSRYDSVQKFLNQLDKVEDELTTPDAEASVDPATAGARDRLEGGFTVMQRMGRGASSDVLLVHEDSSEEPLILKVARDLAHNDRLVAEGEVLAQLRHPNIVEYRRTLSLAGRSALLLRSAGEQTLADQLKSGRLSLDLLQRFGEELISAVNYLESEGVAHRDIKPENIGIARARSSKRLQLVLFDFSLSRTPAENIAAGTHPYLDPFLAERKPPRWDLYAERFALGVTLYEMAVGQPPVWGDGQTSPAMLDVEATIEREVFDPVTRDGFTAFFSKALRRDFRQRFHNAEEMLRAWRAIFEPHATAQAPQAQGFEAIALAATPATTMAELGYSLEAQDVLERMGVHNARELLAVDRIRFRYLKGVGDKVRKEIRLRAKELAQLRPDLTQGRNTVHADEDAEGAVSINELAALLLPRRPAGDDRADDAALEHYLGLGESAPALAWPSVGEAAQAAQVERGVLTAALVKARGKWLKTPAFTELREQIETLLKSQAQVMSARELAQALLALRGCAEQDDAERLRQAGAVLRAALEAEAHTAKPRFEARGHDPAPLVATSADWAAYARQLGASADACAAADPLLPPARVLQTLESVPLPHGAAPVPPARLLRLAASASRGAALSSRQELYPVGMSAAQALRQSLGALMGAPLLPVRELRERVRGRYPESVPLPGRPQLDQLLDEANAPLQWDPTADGGRGAYRGATLGSGPTAGTATLFSRQPTQMGRPDDDAALQVARHAEERLQRSLRQGGLLVLGVEPRLARHAEDELLRRFGAAQAAAGALRRLSLDALLLRELKAQAGAARVDWSVVLRADAAEAGSRDWGNLLRLVQRCVPSLRAALLDAPSPLLLVHAGLLARYQLMPLLSELEATAGRPGRTPAAWLLLPSHEAGRPLIDGEPVPLVNAAQALPLPQAWIENKHRATAAA